MTILKKLFTIRYRNKEFLILVDEYHRKTFLEITKDNQYLYPEYEDFVALDQIYNNYDYTIKYSDKLSRIVKYKEMVRYKAALLLLVAGTYIFCARSNIKIDDQTASLNVDYQSQYELPFDNYDMLNQIYGDEVITRDDVIRVINDNDKLPDKYKEMAIDVLDNNLSLDPDANLRVFYENMKDLEIVYITTDEMSHNGTTRIAAYFKVAEHKIYLTSDDESSDREAYHEFIHAFHELIDTEGDDNVYIYETLGHSLVEAMTEKIANNKYNYGYTHYGTEQRLLNFFLNSVDNFNYHTYNEKGITALIDELKERYPGSDIDYLIDYIDNFIKTHIYDIENTSELYEDEDFCNELFKMAISNIDKSNIYKSLDNFIAALGKAELYEKYYDRYNNELISQQIINKEQLNSINSICILDGRFYFSSSVNTYINYNGENININKSSSPIFLPINRNVKNKIIQSMVDGNVNVFSSEFICNVLDDHELYTADFYRSLRELDYDNKIEIINDVFELKVANINPQNLYANFGSIVNFMNCDYDLFYGTTKYDEYAKMYDSELIKRGFVTQKQIDFIRGTICIVNCDGKIYLLNDYCYGYFSSMVDETQLGDVYTTFPFGDVLELKSINNENQIQSISVNTDVLEVLNLDDYAKKMIIQYAVDNGIEDITSQDFLGKLNEEFEVFKQKKYNTFSDGSNAFDDINDNMYVEIGLIKENSFGLMLYDGDKVVYGTCEKLDCPTAKIPFKEYLKLIKRYQYNYLDQIISEDALLSNSSVLLQYLIPNLDIDNQTIIYSYNGESSIKYETIYKFNEPVKTFVDGVECPLRNIFLYQDSNYNLVLHMPSGNKIIMGNISDKKYWFISNYQTYFTFFDAYLKYLNILPDENNTYNFTEDEIIQIVNNYINSEKINGYNK